MNTSFLKILIILAAMPGFASASDNFVLNGDFSSGGDGWLITDTPGGFGYWPVGGNPGGNVFLDNTSPSLVSDPTASQEIAGLTPGTQYLISGDYLMGKTRGIGLPTGPSFGVAIDGNFLFTLEPNIPFTWQRFGFTYVATSSDITLNFSSQINGTGISANIDNIAMYAIPEPGSFTVALISLALFVSRKARCGGVKKNPGSAILSLTHNLSLRKTAFVLAQEPSFLLSGGKT